MKTAERVVAKTTQTESNAYSIKYAWFVVGLLMVAYTLSFIDRQILSLLVGPIKRDLSISDTQISLLQGFAFALFYTLVGIPCGRLVDILNRKWLVTIGITLWSLMTMGCGLVNTYINMFLMRMGVGVGEATLNPSAYSLISDYFPRNKLGKAMGIYAIGIYFGAGLAYIVGGSVIAIVESSLGATVTVMEGITLKSWQLTFMIVGIPGLIVALIIAAFLREPGRTGLTSKLGVSGKTSFGDVLRFIWQHKRTFFPLFAGISMISPLGYVILAWGPEFFIRTYAMERATIGIIFGLIVVVFGCLGIVHSGLFADRLIAKGRTDSYFRVVTVAGVCLMLPCILMPLSGSAIFSLVLLAPIIYFSAFPYSCLPAAIQVVTPNQMRGSVSAIYMFIANMTGIGLGPTIVALLTDNLFQDEAALKYSIALVCGVAAPLSALFFYWGYKGLRKSIEDSSHW